MKETFTTPIECWLYNLNKLTGYDTDGTATATVHWSIEPEMRERGIKSMNAIITKVKVSGELKIDVEQIPEENQKSMESEGWDFDNTYATKDLEFDSESWEIENGMKFSNDGGLIPSVCDIDFMNKKITVE